MELSNLRIKNRVPLNVMKIKSDAMLVLLNMTMELSNVRKKVRKPPNVTKDLSHVIFFFFLRNNYNLLLTPQLKTFSPKSPSTLYMERCQFSYKAFGVTCDVRTAQCEDQTVKCEKKNKGTTKYEKRTVTYDVGTAQCEDEIVKCEKKLREPQNVRKELSHVMLELHNVRMEPSNVRKKKVREPPNMRK